MGGRRRISCHRGWRLALAMLLAIVPAGAGRSDEPSPPPSAQPAADEAGTVRDLLSLDVEQLSKVDVKVAAPIMNQEVTTVSKQESTVGRSPAAVYVITQEMIHRSACNNIPDLLRLVPGLQVARIDAHTWAISSRGFSDRYTDKLLVLIDGRTVYSPLFSGVYWDVQDVMLEDIDRIEVIRGPGGTIWGANAVNGVINIITKKAKDSNGALVTYGGGTEDRGLGAFRYGNAVGEDFNYRIYGKHKEEAPGYSSTTPADDAWRQGRAGFRADWNLDRAKQNLFTVQGDYYQGYDGVSGSAVLPTPPYETQLSEYEFTAGGNVLTRFTHTIDESSDWSLQMYFDHAQRAFSLWKQNVNTFDTEFQHRFALGDRHKIIWGSDYRQIHDDEASDGFNLNWDPAHRTTDLFSMFVQDEIALVEDRLFFTVGSKFEHNDYTGFEYQPSGRLLYAPDQKHSLWAAISRAVRTPSRFEQGGPNTFVTTQPDPDPSAGFPRATGNWNFRSEDLMAYEIGYRAQPEERFAYDIALFYNVYESMADMLPTTPYTDSYGNLIVPAEYYNGARGRTYGVEVCGEWKLTEKWRVNGSYTYLHLDFDVPADQAPTYLAGANPCNQVKGVSQWDLGEHWQFDAILRYVDELPASGAPSYLTMDLRMAWTPRKNLEVAVYGRNLLQNHHIEFAEYPPMFFYGTEVARSVYGKVTWKF